MLSSVKFDIPQELAARLHPLKDQLPRILELGLRELNAITQPDFEGAAEILEFLASLPTPEEILALHPSKNLQDRISNLLKKNRTVGLTSAEQREWEQYQYLEHLVRVAKAKAYLKLKES
jgi:hypothetical protein